MLQRIKKTIIELYNSQNQTNRGIITSSIHRCKLCIQRYGAEDGEGKKQASLSPRKLTDSDVLTKSDRDKKLEERTESKKNIFTKKAKESKEEPLKISDPQNFRQVAHLEFDKESGSLKVHSKFYLSVHLSISYNLLLMWIRLFKWFNSLQLVTINN